MLRYVQFNNTLKNETSAYLQQHANQPVAWQPWTEDAFRQAAERDVPVFISIGYATCHWCHVMSNESFCNHRIADYLNEHFVCIKVDREESPDVDAFYMEVCQATTGIGGWPLTIVSDASKRPFYVGTYFPPFSTAHRLGLFTLLQNITEAWQHQRPSLLSGAGKLVESLRIGMDREYTTMVSDNVFPNLLAWHNDRFDEEYGGFGGAPKFPTAHRLLALMHIAYRTRDAEALRMVERTLVAMRAGGLYDHVGFGFHRYSTDRRWEIPHFEKMLADQAMLMLAYTEGWRATHLPLFKQTVNELATYVKRELTHSSGAFKSAQDADVDGKEGAYYLFSVDELEMISPLLSPHAEFGGLFGISVDGNFAHEVSGEHTGYSHLFPGPENLGAVLHHDEWEGLRSTLLEFRNRRYTLATDSKVLPDWNGLMIAALAKAYRVFGEEEYLAMAQAAMQAVEPRIGVLDDVAALALAGLELYQSTGNTEYIDLAKRYVSWVETAFTDANGAVYMTSHETTQTPVRMRMPYDTAYPSGNSIAALANALAGGILGQEEYKENGSRQVQQYAEMFTSPEAFCMLLTAWDLLVSPQLTVSISDKWTEQEVADIVRTLSCEFIPSLYITYITANTKQVVFCTNNVCEEPLHSMQEVVNRIAQEKRL